MATITPTDVLTDPFAGAHQLLSQSYEALDGAEHLAYRPRKIIKFSGMSGGDVTAKLDTRGYRHVRVMMFAGVGTPTATFAGSSDAAGTHTGSIPAAASWTIFPTNTDYGECPWPPHWFSVVIAGGVSETDVYIELLP